MTSFAKGYPCQQTTLPERIIADACHRGRNRDCGQRVATRERLLADACDGVPLGGYRGNHNIGIGAGADAANIAGTITVRGKGKPLARVLVTATGANAVYIVVPKRSFGFLWQQDLTAGVTLSTKCQAILGTGRLIPLELHMIAMYVFK